jgi:hypothetical protein
MEKLLNQKPDEFVRRMESPVKSCLVSSSLNEILKNASVNTWELSNKERNLIFNSIREAYNVGIYKCIEVLYKDSTVLYQPVINKLKELMTDRC